MARKKTHSVREAVIRVIDTSPHAGRLARKMRRWFLSSVAPYLNRVELPLSYTVLDRLKVRNRRFDDAFRSGAWTSTGESLSGDGSSLAATEKLRAALPGTMEELAVKTLLDVPCGDWNWMSHVDLPVERYIGGDIVTSLIRQNQERFSNPHRTFRIIDLCTDELPAADLLLCRDALVHFSFRDIWRAIGNMKKARISYIATTTFPATGMNIDQRTGIPWRHLNLEAAPFSFPQPFRTLVDDFNRPDQILAFWRVSDLPNDRKVNSALKPGRLAGAL